jgi:hypothetical protein
MLQKKLNYLPEKIAEINTDVSQGRNVAVTFGSKYCKITINPFVPELNAHCTLKDRN